MALGVQTDLVIGREFGSHRLPYIFQNEAPALQPEMQGRNYVTAVRSSSFPKPPRADNDDDNDDDNDFYFISSTSSTDNDDNDDNDDFFGFERFRAR